MCQIMAWRLPLCNNMRVNITLWHTTSKKLTPAKQNYSTLKKEFLAIVWEMTKFHLYLAGNCFILQMDHQLLAYLNHAKFHSDHGMLSHSFPSIWKTSSIIPIHKMGEPLDSPASFRSISLISCISKLFERIILSRLLFFLKSNSFLSPHQAGFRPGRSTLNQILYLSQSILNRFNKPRPSSRTIFSTIDFSKAFDSVWHPTLFYKLISTGLPLCFACWTQSFLSEKLTCVVFQNHKSHSF